MLTLGEKRPTKAATHIDMDFFRFVKDDRES